MPYLVMFDPRRIELQKELVHHPKLCELINNHPVSEFETRLAEIAAWCGVLLDGYYTPEELSKLCEILRDKLYESRTEIILRKFDTEDATPH